MKEAILDNDARGGRHGSHAALATMGAACATLALTLFLAPCQSVAADTGSEGSEPTATREAPAAPARDGYFGPTVPYQLDTVARAVQASEGSDVELTGFIAASLQNYASTYLFRDGTGEILVNIHGALFTGMKLDERTRVHLRGSLDRTGMATPQVLVARLDLAPLPVPSSLRK